MVSPRVHCASWLLKLSSPQREPDLDLFPLESWGSIWDNSDPWSFGGFFLVWGDFLNIWRIGFASLCLVIKIRCEVLFEKLFFFSWSWLNKSFQAGFSVISLGSCLEQVSFLETPDSPEDCGCQRFRGKAAFSYEPWCLRHPITRERLTLILDNVRWRM